MSHSPPPHTHITLNVVIWEFGGIFSSILRWTHPPRFTVASVGISALVDDPRLHGTVDVSVTLCSCLSTLGSAWGRNTCTRQREWLRLSPLALWAKWFSFCLVCFILFLRAAWFPSCLLKKTITEEDKRNEVTVLMILYHWNVFMQIWVLVYFALFY